MSIDMLPDDVLLDIFGFYVDEAPRIEAWQSLVHVCRRWRSIAFRSPRRLNLRLVCSNETPARDTLDVRPALPLFIQCYETVESMDKYNIVAVLERNDRVCDITLVDLKRWEWEKISAAMQVPFPELTHLQLWSYDEAMSVLPDSFLGRYVPRLEFLWLARIPFPGLPNLLLSATHLVSLRLQLIPRSGYFSPEGIVTALSTLSRLTTLSLHFESPQSRPDPARQRPHPLTRSVLPALAYFRFKGVSEYLEVVVARINAPRLSKLDVTFFNDIVFDTPQFTQFIRRTPMLKGPQKARVTFEDDAAVFNLSSQTSGKYGVIEVTIPCRELDWQISSMEQICTSCLPPLLTLEHLYIYENPHWREHWQDNIENALWLELLHPFTSVKNLYISSDIARRIVPALQELVRGRLGRATEVLPALQYIFLEERQVSGPVEEGIQLVIAVRQAIGHPIAVSNGQKVRFA
jgi:F-box-like